MNYNDQDINNGAPFPQFNEEVLFHNIILQGNYYGIYSFYTHVDSNLVASYAENDLRRLAFLITLIRLARCSKAVTVLTKILLASPPTKYGSHLRNVR